MEKRICEGGLIMGGGVISVYANTSGVGETIGFEGTIWYIKGLWSLDFEKNKHWEQLGKSTTGTRHCGGGGGGLRAHPGRGVMNIHANTSGSGLCKNWTLEIKYKGNKDLLGRRAIFLDRV